MAIREKARQLAIILLRNTPIGNSEEIDVNDLNLYISYAVESGLINESEIYNKRVKKT